MLKRKEKSELEKNQYKRYRQKEEPFRQVDAQGNHEVWAIDFLKVLLFGIYFPICVVYEIFSQSYLSIKPAICATSEIAGQALEEACQYSGQIPKKCLLADNGSQFNSYGFEEIKQRLQIQSQYIPRGQPWYNGALESGNRDLRRIIYTIAFYDVCQDTQPSRVGIYENIIFAYLQSCCNKALRVINETIARSKFKTTPMAVLKYQVAERQEKRIQYIEKKKQERNQRMQQLKIDGGSKRKRIEDKVAIAWRKTSSMLNTEQIFAFSEMLNNRYKAIMI